MYPSDKLLKHFSLDGLNLQVFCNWYQYLKKRDRNYDLDSEVKVNIKFGSQKWNILNYCKQHVKYSMKAILVLWDVCFYGTFLSGNWISYR